MMKEKTALAQIKGVNNGYVFYPLRRHSAIVALWFEGHIKAVFSIIHTQTNETWCGVFTDVAYQIPWCGALKFGTPQKGVKFPDVAYGNIVYLAYFFYFLMWRTIYYISWCGVYIALSISWYGVHPVFPDVAYFSCFLMWRTIYCIAWCGVYIVLQTYIIFPDMAYILYFLMWRISCISWCGVQ